MQALFDLISDLALPMTSSKIPAATPPVAKAAKRAHQLMSEAERKVLLTNQILRSAPNPDEVAMASRFLVSSIQKMADARSAIAGVRKVFGREHLLERWGTLSEVVNDLAYKILTAPMSRAEEEFLGPGEWDFRLTFPHRPPEGDPFQLHRRSRMHFWSAGRSLLGAAKNAAMAKILMESRPSPHVALMASDMLSEAAQDLTDAGESMSILASRGFLPSKKVLDMWKSARQTILSLEPMARMASQKHPQAKKFRLSSKQ